MINWFSRKSKSSKLFDINENNISKGNTANLDNRIETVEKHLKKKLPPSYIQWLRLYGENIGINGGSGNFITDDLFPQKAGDEISSVSHGAAGLKKAHWPVTNDFIPFGGDGGENQFAFYTKFSKNGEYPVLLVSLDDEDQPYVLMATSFKGFVNTYVNLEIFRKEIQDDNELIRIAKDSLKKYEPHFPLEFAEQLVSWEWKFNSLKEIDFKLRKLIN